MVFEMETAIKPQPLPQSSSRIVVRPLTTGGIGIPIPKRSKRSLARQRKESFNKITRK